jgi:anaerobic ribonucleoside-triphosphate reductase
VLLANLVEQEKALKSLNQELSIQYGSLNLFDNYLVRNHINNDLQDQGK